MAAFLSRTGVAFLGLAAFLSVPTYVAADDHDCDECWAVVAADGRLVRSDDARSSRRLAAGDYLVRFDEAVTGCAFNATIGSPGTGEPPRGGIGVAREPRSATGVLVFTYSPSGAPADRPFHLSVNCDD
jgi:hypothetical protein